MKPLYRIFVLLVLTLGGPAGFALADEDHERARALMQAGEILPLAQILEKARAQHPGRVLEAELEREDGVYVYEVELVDAGGVVWELAFDARTGELLEHKREP